MVRVLVLVAMLVGLALGLPTQAVAQDGSGVSNRELFGVEGDAAEDPADPPPQTEPRRKGVSATGEAKPLPVRTGLSPREVKREPTPEELAAQEAERRRRQAEEAEQQWMTAMFIFVGVVLLVLVMGGMAYAALVTFLGKDESEETPPEGEDAFAHLVQRDPTPAPAAGAAPFRTPSATPAPLPQRRAPEQPAPRTYPDTPPSVPSRYPAQTSDPGHDLISRARSNTPTPGGPPIITPTATPAPKIASRTPRDATPAGYVPPVRPGSGPASPVPVQTADGGPAYLPPKETPVPTFSTVEGTVTPAPASSTPDTAWRFEAPPTDSDSFSVLDGQSLDMDMEDDEVILAPKPAEVTTADDAFDPWTVDPMTRREPIVRKRVATPPSMPWRTKR